MPSVLKIECLCGWTVSSLKSIPESRNAIVEGKFGRKTYKLSPTLPSTLIPHLRNSGELNASAVLCMCVFRDFEKGETSFYAAQPWKARLPFLQLRAMFLLFRVEVLRKAWEGTLQAYDTRRWQCFRIWLELKKFPHREVVCFEVKGWSACQKRLEGTWCEFRRAVCSWKLIIFTRKRLPREIKSCCTLF